MNTSVKSALLSGSASVLDAATRAAVRRERAVSLSAVLRVDVSRDAWIRLLNRHVVSDATWFRVISMITITARSSPAS